MHFTECSIDELEEKAYLLSVRVSPPTSILLWGEMGAGKTTFAKAFIEYYFGEGDLNIVSPTFTLVQTYSQKIQKNNPDEVNSFNSIKKNKKLHDIWHVDLYRLNNLNEVLELGLEEALYKEICLIEWPDRLGGLFIPNCINVYLNVVNETTRAFAIQYENATLR